MGVDRVMNVHKIGARSLVWSVAS